MRIPMKHPAFKGGANVLPADRKTWEAAGWAAVPDDTKTTTTKKGNDQ